MYPSFSQNRLPPGEASSENGGRKGHEAGWNGRGPAVPCRPGPFSTGQPRQGHVRRWGRVWPLMACVCTCLYIYIYIPSSPTSIAILNFIQYYLVPSRPLVPLGLGHIDLYALLHLSVYQANISTYTHAHTHEYTHKYKRL